MPQGGAAPLNEYSISQPAYDVNLTSEAVPNPNLSIHENYRVDRQGGGAVYIEPPKTLTDPMPQTEYGNGTFFKDQTYAGDIHCEFWSPN